jgi:hypothetical protein
LPAPVTVMPTVSCSSRQVFTCFMCNFQCSHSQNLRRHLQIRHFKKEHVLCNVCHKTFCRLDSLRRHEAMHNSVKT